MNDSETELKWLASVDLLIRSCIAESAVRGLVDMSNHHFSAAGKGLRPRIALSIGHALGLEPEKLTGWAAGCELLHNATLVHDDLQDGDLIRRGQPTVWSKYGAAQAINLGDLMMLVAPQTFLKTPISQAGILELCKVFSITASRIVGGQSVEPDLQNLVQQHNYAALEKAYFECIELKTAALFEGIAQGVAVIAGLSSTDQKSLAQLFSELGVLFQIQDDVLDIYGDKKRDQIGSDIKEGKISFLVVTYLKSHNLEREKLISILLKPRNQTSDDDVKWVIALFERTDLLANALDSIRARIQLITENPWVRQHPGIAACTTSLLTQILAPIRHLFATSESPTLPTGELCKTQ